MNKTRFIGSNLIPYSTKYLDHSDAKGKTTHIDDISKNMAVCVLLQIVQNK